MNRKILSAFVVFALLANILTLLPINGAYAVELVNDTDAFILPDRPMAPSPPIWISADFTTDPSVKNPLANGTEADPYIIENLEIDGSGSGYCIFIENTNKFFIIRNCTLENSNDAGLLMLGSSNGIIENCTIINNQGSGIKAESEFVDIEVYNSTISDNEWGGVIINADKMTNSTFVNNIINSNLDKGGIGIRGMPEIAVIRTEIHDNELSNNDGLCPIRLGSKLNPAQDDLPVHSIYTNITNNDIINPGGNFNGIIMIYATEYIQANIMDNDFNTPQTQNGVHIGKMSNEYSKNPGVRNLDVNFINNNLTNIAAGALILCSTESLYANVSDNYIYHTTGITCGAVTIGWFKAGVDTSTPKNATVILKNNILEKVADTIGFGIKAIYDLNVTIEDNTVDSVNAPGIRVGWLGDGDASNAPEPWAYPTRNVHGSISNNTITGGRGQGIWLYSLNNSIVNGNQVSGRDGTSTNGDGIRIDGARGNNIVSNNVITEAEAIGIRLYNSKDVVVKDNTLNSNQYGLGVDYYSNNNQFFSNTILKNDVQYGYFIEINSLNNSYPANNTVNGEWLRYFYGLEGADGALVPVQNHIIDERLLSNLGQVIVANSSYVEIKDNDVNNGSYGLALINTHDSVAFDNDCESNIGGGLVIREEGKDNSIFQNILTNNGYGIGLSGITSGNIFWNNLITKGITQTGMYIDNSGYSWENTIYENNTVDGESVRYYHGESGHTITGEQILVSYITNLGQISYVNSTDIQFNDVDIQNGNAGVYIINGDRVDVFDSILENNRYGFFASLTNDIQLANIDITSSITNVFLSNTENINIEECHLEGGDRSIYLYKSDPFIANSTIENAVSNSTSLNGDSHPVLLNTTFDKSQVYVSDPLSNLSVRWYLDIHVSSNGKNISEAKILIIDNDGANVFENMTQETGWIDQLIMTEYIVAMENNTDIKAPYNVTVQKDGLGSFNASIDMGQSTILLIELDDETLPLIENISLSPSNVTGMSGDWVWLNATMDEETTGWSNITGAEWYVSYEYPTIENGTGNPCNASDGSFDSTQENITALLEIPSFPKGTSTIWIHGSDEGGNWCEWESINLTIFDDWGPVVVSGPTFEPDPFSSSMDEITISITFDDEERGKSVITGIDWRFVGEWPAGVNQTGWSSISSLDWAFDEWKEAVNLWFNTSLWERGDYILEIRGIDDYGNRGEWANITIEVLDDESPESPIGLMVTNEANGALNLTWNSSSEGDLVGYNVYRSESSGRRYVLIASILASSDPFFTDAGIVLGTTYYYVVTAFDDQSPPNESPFSEEGTGTSTVVLISTTDTDGDGIDDNVDTDDDNDGIPDSEDAMPLDTDNDGVNNNVDTDDDNDGIPDSEDTMPLDTDNDGENNDVDTDDDGDGIPDSEDTHPLTPAALPEEEDESPGTSGYIWLVLVGIFLVVLFALYFKTRGKGKLPDDGERTETPQEENATEELEAENGEKEE